MGEITCLSESAAYQNNIGAYLSSLAVYLHNIASARLKLMCDKRPS